jgi:hypothetical protein
MQLRSLGLVPGSINNLNDHGGASRGASDASPTQRANSTAILALVLPNDGHIAQRGDAVLEWWMRAKQPAHYLAPAQRRDNT